MSSPNQFNGTPAESNAFLDFKSDEGIYLLTEGDGTYIILDESVPYPENYKGNELDSLLLKGSQNEAQRTLALPINFVAMPHALNDAIGDNTSTRSKELARGLFEEVGKDLARVAMKDGIVPEELSYKNIVFSREGRGTKLLPPLSFVKFAERDKDQAVKHVETSLRESLESGAANTTQRQNTMAVYGGFLEGFRW